MAALILMVMANYNPSEEDKHRDTMMIPKSCEKNTFWILLYIMKEKGIRDMFVDNCPRLVENMFKLDTMIKDELPELHEHMMENGVMVNSCMPHYFLTICT